MRGSGSDTVRAERARVLPEHADVDLVSMPPRYDNPVFRIPVPLRLSYNKVAIALGIARATLDAFVDLANHKVPMLSPSKLKDRPIAQIRLAECEGKYRAVRAYVMEAMRDVETELHAGAELPSAATTQNARLACVVATNACMEIVDVLHNAAGSSASYMANPLERRLRDAHAVASHRWVSHALYEDLGAILMGHDADPEFAGTGGPGLGSRKR
jgi:alkylation response protein AidB-like acyl-CoA dehydrogenase